MNKPKIFYTKYIIPPYRGMTIPPLGIFIKKQYKGNTKILKHDLIHWQQYQKLGLFKFYTTYIYQYFKFGYNKMPLEIEARFEEDEYTKTHYKEKYFKSNQSK